DNAGGWGVDAISYSLAGAQAGAGSFQVGGAITIAAEGDTTIRYFATDVAGNVEAARAFMIRIDSTAPTLSLPGSFSIDATGPEGARANYDVTAADNSGLAPALACLPESGSTLPIGTHTIGCTATDAAGNAAHGSFNVTVRRDTTPPVTTVSVSVPANAQGWNTGAVTVTFAAADNA